MKLTRHNGRAGKMVLTIPSIMTAGLTLRTVSILMLTGQSKISIGIVTPDFLLQQ